MCPGSPRMPALVQKVVACLLRTRDEEPDLLVFVHPVNGATQIPKGTLEDRESAELAVVRELEEETGIPGATIEAKVAELVHTAPRGPAGRGPLEEQFWHVFSLRTEIETPDAWDHEASGSPEEEGLIFACRWLPLPEAAERVHAYYKPVVQALLGSTAKDRS